MKAIIFAAGLSSRLGELTKELPKSCLAITKNQNMIERNLFLLIKNGFTDITIITGHAKEAFAEIITKQKIKINTIYNELYIERNNIYTAYLCKDILDEDTLILNSDLVLEEEIIKIAQKQMQSSKESFMLIDDFNQVDEESMKVYVDENQKITRVNKALNLEQSLGEYIGVLRISNEDKPCFIESMQSILDKQEFNLYYEDAIDRASAKMNVHAISTQGKLWTEIDTLEDLAKARELAKNLEAELKV